MVLKIIINMCGINGLFKYSGVTEEEISNIHLMNDQMKYRGPDDFGIWFDNKAIMSQVRLSIIGIDNGKQPILNESGTLVLVCNGEIYNYRSIKKYLEGNGHVFKTNTDSEVIIHLYEEVGVECLDQLRGMFAFALYDVCKKELVIARDRVGKKPLYYSNIPCGFVFSSEIKAIKRCFLTGVSPDYTQIRQIMRFSYPQDEEATFIKQVKRIRPGEYAVISDNGMEISSYWRKTNTYNFSGSYNEAKDETLKLLIESISLRMRSDVPIALLLSGGIDSSAIGALAAETHDNIQALTVGYGGSYDCDERTVARKFALEKGINWTQIELDQADYQQYFEELVEFIDEPICDVAAIAQWGIYKKASEEGLTVLLSGNGGDELFYGYPAHNTTAENIAFLNQRQKMILSGEGRSILSWLKFIFSKKETISKFLKTYNLHLFDGAFYKGLLELEYDWPDNDSYSEGSFSKFSSVEKYPIDQVYSYLFNIWLVNNCYFLSDKLGMAHSLEVRAPFADNKLVDFVSSLPIEYKYYPNNPKGFLKDVVKGYVPDYILHANKKGFTPPFDVIHDLVKKYNSKFFNTKLTSYNQILLDKFLYDASLV